MRQRVISTCVCTNRHYPMMLLLQSVLYIYVPIVRWGSVLRPNLRVTINIRRMLDIVEHCCRAADDLLSILLGQPVKWPPVRTPRHRMFIGIDYANGRDYTGVALIGYKGKAFVSHPLPGETISI
jgi:hypothetical protein